MQRKFGFWATICLLLCVTGCKRDRAEGYQFITKDFQAAIQQITPEYFFGSPLPDMPVRGLSYPKLTKEELHKKLIGDNYEALGQALCQSIAVNYASMFDNRIAGKDAYLFDEELTKVMRDAGAYVLPLRVTDGRVEATYYNPHWKSGESDKAGNLKFSNEYYSIRPFRRLANGPDFKTNGTISIFARAFKDGGDYVNFYPFNDMAINGYGFEVKDFDSVFDFIHGYLFVFMKDPDDVTQDRIFYYIDLPFQVSGQKYGEISSLGMKQGSKGQAQCYTLSNYSLFYRGVTVPLRFVDQNRAVAAMTDLEPLTIPIHKEYAMRSVPKPDGQTGLVKNDGYEVLAADMAEPSLKCWLLALGYIEGDYAACRNTGYAAEYIKMMNNNICVWKDRITKAPEINYPYKALPGVHEPDHANGAIGFINRCSPEPYSRKY